MGNLPQLETDGEVLEPWFSAALYKLGTVAVTTRLLNRTLCYYALDAMDYSEADAKLCERVVDRLLGVLNGPS